MPGRSSPISPMTPFIFSAEICWDFSMALLKALIKFCLSLLVSWMTSGSLMSINFCSALMVIKMPSASASIWMFLSCFLICLACFWTL